MPRLPGIPGSRAARDVLEAPTTTSVRDVAVTTQSSITQSTATRERVGRQASLIPTPRRERVVERRAVLVAIALLAGVVGAAAISRSIADVIDARAQVVAAHSFNEGIRDQVEAGRREIDFAQDEAYLRFAARGFDYGRARERSFALRGGARPPPPIEPLGADLDQPTDDVLSDFLDLLLQP